MQTIGFVQTQVVFSNQTGFSQHGQSVKRMSDNWLIELLLDGGKNVGPFAVRDLVRVICDYILPPLVAKLPPLHVYPEISANSQDEYNEVAAYGLLYPRGLTCGIGVHYDEVVVVSTDTCGYLEQPENGLNSNRCIAADKAWEHYVHVGSLIGQTSKWESDTYAIGLIVWKSDRVRGLIGVIYPHIFERPKTADTAVQTAGWAGFGMDRNDPRNLPLRETRLYEWQQRYDPWRECENCGQEWDTRKYDKDHKCPKWVICPKCPDISNYYARCCRVVHQASAPFATQPNNGMYNVSYIHIDMLVQNDEMDMLHIMPDWDAMSASKSFNAMIDAPNIHGHRDFKINRETALRLEFNLV